MADAAGRQATTDLAQQLLCDPSRSAHLAPRECKTETTDNVIRQFGKRKARAVPRLKNNAKNCLRQLHLSQTFCQQCTTLPFKLCPSEATLAPCPICLGPRPNSLPGPPHPPPPPPPPVRSEVSKRNCPAYAAGLRAVRAGQLGSLPCCS